MHSAGTILCMCSYQLQRQPDRHQPGHFKVLFALDLALTARAGRVLAGDTIALDLFTKIFCLAGSVIIGPP